MKFLKDFFYINYSERRALLIILTLQAIMKTDFSRAKYSPLTPIRQANLISNGWDWNHGKPEASSNIEIKEVSSGHQETLHGFTD